MARPEFTTRLAFAGSIVVTALCTGCWEEIEYQGPTPSESAQTAAVPPSTQSPTTAESTPAEEGAEAPVTPPPDTAQPADYPALADVTPNEAGDGAPEFADDFAESMPEPVAREVMEQLAPPEPGPEVDRYAMPAAETSAAYAATDSHVEDGVAAANGSLTASPPDLLDHQVVGESSANTFLSAWQLGSKLCLAALANDRGVAADNVREWFAESRSLAESLGTVVAKLPEPAAVEEEQAASQTVLNYLLSQGQRIGRDLGRQHSVRHPALFEVAMKSNLLRVMYEPGSTATKQLSASIAAAAERAELPADMSRPLFDSLATGAELDKVREAVKRLHAHVEQHLAHMQADSEAVADTMEEDR